MKMFNSSLKELRSVRTLTTAAMLMALNLALSGVRVQITPELRLSFNFLTQVIVGMLYGPVVCMLTGAAGDILSATVFPTGSYFPGFTLTAIVSGLIYGVALYKRERVGYVRALVGKGLVNVLCNIVLNTVWLAILQGQAFYVILPARVLKNVALLPVEALLITLVTTAAHRALKAMPRR